MGGESDEDEAPNALGKNNELCSYLYRRVPRGVSKQFNNNISGSHYVDLKLYMCDEIATVSPMNRWRHAVVTLKLKTDENTAAYRYLVKFLKEIKKNFKNAPVTYVSTPNQ